MFDCRTCAAKDAEIARLVAQVGELNDRLMAMVGQAYQSQLAALTAPPPGGQGQEPDPEEQTDEEWANEQLEQAAEEARKCGRLRPDLPT